MSVRNKTRRAPAPAAPQAPLLVTRPNNQASQITEKSKYRTMAYQAFHRLRTQTNHTNLDWNWAHIRIGMGVLIFEQHFNHEEEVKETLNRALVALHISWVRFDLAGVLGLTPAECDSILDAFAIVDVLFNELSLYEIKEINLTARRMYDNIAAMNRPAALAVAVDPKERMLQQLAAEYQQVNDKKVA